MVPFPRSLKRIDVGGNGISSLPADFGAHLPRLATIGLEHNAFTEVPQAALATAAALEAIDLQHNGALQVESPLYHLVTLGQGGEGGRHVREALLDALAGADRAARRLPQEEEPGPRKGRGRGAVLRRKRKEKREREKYKLVFTNRLPFFSSCNARL